MQLRGQQLRGARVRARAHGRLPGGDGALLTHSLTRALAHSLTHALTRSLPHQVPTVIFLISRFYGKHTMSKAFMLSFTLGGSVANGACRRSPRE